MDLYTIIAREVKIIGADNDQNLVLGLEKTIFVCIDLVISFQILVVYLEQVLLPDGNGVNEALIDVQGVGTAYTSNERILLH